MVIAEKCMFVSGAKQNYVKQANKVVVPVTGRGSRSTLRPGKGRQSCMLRLIRIRSRHFGYTCFAPVPPAIHLLLGQSKPVSSIPSKNKIKPKAT